MQVSCNTVQNGLFSHTFGEKDTPFWMEIVSHLAYEFLYCVNISVNKTLPKSGHLVQ